MESESLKLLRLPEVVQVTGLPRGTVYWKLKRGEFPKPVKIGPKAVAWRSDQVQAWIESCTS
jgi:prophage regulatory protein